jgi:hypothetical protein
MTNTNKSNLRSNLTICVLALAVCLALAAHTSAETPNRERYLVLDSRIIDKTNNVELTVGVVDKYPANPLFGEDKPWEPRFDNPYCSVIYDEEEKIWKCWYSIFIRSGGRGKFPGEGLPSEKRAWVNWREGKRGFGVCYATSKDGLKWVKPELGLIDYDGSKKNNIVIEYTHGVAVMKDPQEKDPKKRYKAIHPERGKSMVWFSADGIRWGKGIDVGPIDRGDTNQSIFRDPATGKYVLITRGWGGAKTKGRYGRMGHRQKVRSESTDFLKWSKPEPAISGLDLQNQIHDMLVAPHAGVYIGLVGLFDIKASKQWCELAWSPDSKKWHRIQPGQPLIANSRRMGDYDWGCIFAAKPIIRKDGIILYYGANDGRFMAWRNGFFCLANLRADGFAGYEQIEGGSNKTGSLTTKPVTVITDALQISADIAPSGFVRTTVLDEAGKQLAEGKLVTKTVTDATIEWKDSFSLKKLKGKDIRLKFELRESKLYSFSFGTSGTPTKPIAIIPQAKPVFAWLQAVKTGDKAQLKALFSQRMQTRHAETGWDKIMNTYQEVFKAEFGDYKLAEFTFEFKGDDKKGQVFVIHKGKKTPGLRVIKEGADWKVNER